MFRFGLFCLMLGVLPGFGENRQQSAVPVTLYHKFQVDPPAAVMAALQDELEVIMDPIGIRFDWRSLNAVRGNEVSVELAVITFKGRCDATGLTFHSVNPGALGWTHVSDGVILPFADVDCDRIREFVQRDLLYFEPKRREGVLGRAIGRVLAHELFHIFANTAHHASDGVAKSAYTVQELLSDDFQFGEGEMVVLQHSPAHTAAADNSGGATPQL